MAVAVMIAVNVVTTAGSLNSVYLLQFYTDIYKCYLYSLLHCHERKDTLTYQEYPKAR